MAFIFGGDTGLSYEEMMRRRAMAGQYFGEIGNPQTFGEGLSALGKGLAAGILGRSANKAEEAGKAQANDLWTSLWGRYYGGGPSASTSGGAVMTPGRQGGSDTTAALGKGPSSYRDAIASIESSGSGDYSAVGPTDAKLGRALGRYQIMEANLPSWSQAALGRQVTADEFMANPQIQDAIFDHRFGGYVQQYGPEGAAQAWFGGPGGVGKTDRKDVLGTTVGDYGRRFMSAIGGTENIPLDVLATAAANPYMSEGQRSVLGSLLQQRMQQQQNASDPAYQIQMQQAQLGLQKSQLELAQMQKPAPLDLKTFTGPDGAVYSFNPATGQAQPLTGAEQPAPLDLKTFTGPDGSVYSFNPATGEAQPLTGAELPDPTDLKTFTGPDGSVYSFNPVTGEALPLTDAKPQPRPMTDEERVQWGIPPDDTAPYYLKDGAPQRIGGGGVTVNNMGENSFDKVFATEDAKTLGAISSAGIEAQSNIGRIDRLGDLMSSGPSGSAAAFKSLLGDYGIATDGLDRLQAAESLINAMVPGQRPPGSGSMSDRDVELFKKSLPRLINTPQGNAQILSTLRAIAQYDMERGEIVQALRSGRINRAQAFEALQRVKNPLAGIAPAPAAPQPQSDDDMFKRYGITR